MTRYLPAIYKHNKLYSVVSAKKQCKYVMYIPSHHCPYSYFTSEKRKILVVVVVVVIIVEAKILEPQISIYIRIEAGIHITFHIMKKVQVVHQLVKYIASTTLPKEYTREPKVKITA